MDKIIKIFMAGIVLFYSISAQSQQSKELPKHQNQNHLIVDRLINDIPTLVLIGKDTVKFTPEDEKLVARKGFIFCMNGPAEKQLSFIKRIIKN